MLVERHEVAVAIPSVDHVFYCFAQVLIPALDLPVRAIDNRLGVAESVFEDGDSTDDGASDRIAKAAGGKAISGELTIKNPVPVPLSAQLARSLIILDKEDPVPLGEHIEASTVQDRVS